MAEVLDQIAKCKDPQEFQAEVKSISWANVLYALLLVLFAGLAVLASRLQPVTLVVQPAEADVSVSGLEIGRAHV